MLYLLLLTVPAALVWLFRFPYKEAERDKQAIDENGSANTLKESFHFWRGVRRGLMVAGMSCAGAAPLLSALFWSWWFAALAIGVAGLGWFFLEFNTQLSLLRGLDPYYLSADSHAAYFPDRLLTKLGWGLKPVMWILLALCLSISVALTVAAISYL